MDKTSRAMTTGGAGVVIGGIAGVAVGLGVIAIPGIGAAAAGGPLAMAIGGAVGAAAGGIIGAFTGGTLSMKENPNPEDQQQSSAEPARDLEHVMQSGLSGTRMYLDGLEMMPRQTTFEEIEHEYRDDFRGRHVPGYTYEQFSPAYRFGYDVASDPRYGCEEWPAIEEYLRREWEARNPGTWEEVKDAVRYAWQSHKTGRMG